MSSFLFHAQRYSPNRLSIRHESPLFHLQGGEEILYAYLANMWIHAFGSSLISSIFEWLSGIVVNRRLCFSISIRGIGYPLDSP
jgi:hypothetical protein